MQIKNILPLALAALFVTGTTQAQKKSPKKETQIITFDTKNSSSKSGGDDWGKNSLTIGTLSWFNGYVPIYYERGLTDFLSLQIGGGITLRSFGNNIGHYVYDDGAQSDYFGHATSATSDVTDKYQSNKYRKCKPGYYLSVSPRLYFNDNVMDGFYMGPMLEYKKFNYTTQKADEYASDLNAADEEYVPRNGVNFNETMKCLDFALNIGGHFQSDNHMAIAWNVGFGVRSLSATRLDIGYTIAGAGNRYYGNAVKEYSSVRPLFTFDFRIGGWF